MEEKRNFAAKHKKALIVFGVLAVAVIVGVLFLNGAKPAGKPGMEPQTNILAKMELQQTVAANGSVRSASTRQVTSSLSYKITSVLVQEGSHVTEGTLLCELDTTDLDRSIATTQQSINTAVAQDKLKLEQAQRKLQDAINQRDIDQNRLDSDVNNALDSLNNAKNVQTAKASAYQAYAAQVLIEQQKVTYAEAVLNDPDNAANIVDNQKIVDDAKVVLAAAEATANGAMVELQAAEGGVASAQAVYDKAVLTRDTTLRTDNLTIESARDTINTLKLADTTQTMRNQLDTYKRQKQDAKITAPISGTVTKVNAVAGNMAGSGGAAGLTAGASASSLFVIEDLSNLEVLAYIPEYDAVKLTTGLPVRIVTDALEDEEWAGIVKSISLTAADDSGNFEVVVSVTSASGGLTAGMSAKLNIIVESKDNVYAVPYDAVVTGENGQQVVYVWTGTENTKPDNAADMRREVVVQTGMENDYYIEIISAELQDGDKIIIDPNGEPAQAANNVMFFPGGGR